MYFGSEMDCTQCYFGYMCCWLQLHETFSRSFSSGLSWDDLWESPCVGCAHVLGVPMWWVCVRLWTELWWHVVSCFVLLWTKLSQLEMVSCLVLLWTKLSRIEMVLQMVLLWTQLSDLLSRTSLWLSIGGCVPSGWELVDMWIPCYILWV